VPYHPFNSIEQSHSVFCTNLSIGKYILQPCGRTWYTIIFFSFVFGLMFSYPFASRVCRFANPAFESDGPVILISLGMKRRPISALRSLQVKSSTKLGYHYEFRINDKGKIEHDVVPKPLVPTPIPQHEIPAERNDSQESQARDRTIIPARVDPEGEAWDLSDPSLWDFEP
jgi:hypothetical protein